jgi:hypothetical protein
METLKNILWPIVLVGGLGASIDFLIGKTGQAKAKDFLLKWWVKFDDVHRNNFGREEALYAIQLIDYWFGDRFFCVRRLIAVGIILLVSAACGYFIGLLLHQGLLPQWQVIIGSFVFFSIMPFISLSVSISFTRFISAVAARNCGNSDSKNFLIFLGIFATHYLLLGLWVPITQYASIAFEGSVAELIASGPIMAVSDFWFSLSLIILIIYISLNYLSLNHIYNHSIRLTSYSHFGTA